MPLHHAVLALLAVKPAHGYELKSSFEQAVGDQWGGLNIGHLYQVLERLSRDGLIESERRPQPVKPDRLVHRITPAGRAELEQWLAEPSTRTRGYRDDFFLKAMAAVQGGDPALLAGVLSRQRAHLLRELRGLAEARRSADHDASASATTDALILTAAELHIKADLGVVDAAEKALTPEVIAALRIAPGEPAADEAAGLGARVAEAGELAVQVRGVGGGRGQLVGCRGVGVDGHAENVVLKRVGIGGRQRPEEVDERLRVHLYGQAVVRDRVAARAVDRLVAGHLAERDRQPCQVRQPCPLIAGPRRSGGGRGRRDGRDGTARDRGGPSGAAVRRRDAAASASRDGPGGEQRRAGHVTRPPFGASRVS
jgi:DNA-binding PadR family transcriptional regulator